MILHPRPSPIAASMYQLRDIVVDAIILHGPSGCCFRTARLLETDGVSVFTTAMNDNDFIFGALDKLNNTINEVIDYLENNKKTKYNEKYIIGIVGTCASMIIGEDIFSTIDDFKEKNGKEIILIPVDIHSGLNDNTVGAIRVMETCKMLGIISNEEFNRQKYLLEKATEIEKTRGMAKEKYIKPNYDDDLDGVIKLLKNSENLKIACVLNAKKETAYIFANPLIEINKYNIKNNKNNKIYNIVNLDNTIGLNKVKNDATNILKEYELNNINIDYISGGLDEYAVLSDKVINKLKEINPDIIFVSGVPHAIFIEQLTELNNNNNTNKNNKNNKIITIGISDGPRTYGPIKELYNYGIIELDAHSKVLGKNKVVKSRLGEIISYL